MKRLLTRRQIRAKMQHDEWLMQKGVHPSQLKGRARVPGIGSIDVDRVEESQGPKFTSFRSGFAPIPGKRSIFDGYWKKSYDDEEMARRERNALRKAEELKARIMPLYNKGPLQLASEKEDLTKVGSLTRR